MTVQTDDGLSPSAMLIVQRARIAARALARLSCKSRNEVLLACAKAIESAGPRILGANALDLQTAEPLVSSGSMSPAMFSRLCVKENGIKEMAARVREVARLADPLGRRLAATELDNGLVLYKESCPLGVIAVVFESRPDVVPQVAALALKSGNAIILKGGSEAAHSNNVLVSIWRECLDAFPAVPADSIALLETRAGVKELLELEHGVDLVIPRGSRELVRFVAKHSRAPVLGHGEGICHVYVDSAADIQKALAITYDSKVQYPAACNAAETLLVHQAVAREFLPQLVSKLNTAGVELRGCLRTVALLQNPAIVHSTDQDWSTEYSDLILSVKIVDSLADAVEHIHRYGSGHTETIVTEDREAAARFMNDVDAAGVFHNASTRFADGYRYGLGAELGISTNKLHSRGPMGLEGLTTYKYKLFGDGHTVAPYAKGEKHFKHRTLD
jgi:glutamate-5-semialdehyde dehydrogenase